MSIWTARDSLSVTLTVGQLVPSVGLIINVEKSTLVPLQQIWFLGAILLFKEGKAVPMEERVAAATGCAAGLLLAEIAPGRQ